MKVNVGVATPDYTYVHAGMSSSKRTAQPIIQTKLTNSKTGKRRNGKTVIPLKTESGMVITIFPIKMEWYWKCTSTVPLSLPFSLTLCCVNCWGGVWLYFSCCWRGP